MKKLFSTLVLFACATLSLTSCNKDDENVTPSQEALLTAHTWKFSDLTFDVADPFAQASTASMKVMLTGTKYTFKKDHVLISTWNDHNTGSWALSSDGKTLTITEPPFDASSPSFPKKFVVQSLTETTLVFADYDEYYYADEVYTYVKE